MYCKIIHNTVDKIVLDVFNMGVGMDRPRYVKWNKETKEFEISNLIEADGLVSKDGSEVYCINGFEDGFIGYDKPYKKVYIVEIFENEYNRLKDIIKSDFVDIDGHVVPFKNVLETKINELSTECEKTITKGVDLVMSDGQSHHFSFEMSDQLKISKLYDRVKAGETFLPYHADNELCRVFNADEITKLNTAMEGTIEYQITYFNSLKLYLSSLNSDDKFVVYNAQYGMEIPEEFQSEVLKILARNLATINEVNV